LVTPSPSSPKPWTRSCALGQRCPVVEIEKEYYAACLKDPDSFVLLARSAGIWLVMLPFTSRLQRQCGATHWRGISQGRDFPNAICWTRAAVCMGSGGVGYGIVVHLKYVVMDRVRNNPALRKRVQEYLLALLPCPAHFPRSGPFSVIGLASVILTVTARCHEVIPVRLALRIPLKSFTSFLHCGPHGSHCSRS
jgi:hypothetical protein